MHNNYTENDYETGTKTEQNERLFSIDLILEMNSLLTIRWQQYLHERPVVIDRDLFAPIIRLPLRVIGKRH